jgi:indole-3-glycerol phosphate synthase
MDRLQEILAHKRQEIAALHPQRNALRRKALERNEFRSFSEALRGGAGQTLALIAEVKRASPSAGIIAHDFDPVQIARRYEEAGADAVSVLTDERFFQGHLDYLQAIRQTCALPLLRKDFILDEVQIHQATAAGADAVLLIVAALAQSELEHLLGVAEACQLDVLVEVHTLEEMERALAADAQIIGVNNRNLATFQVDLATTETLSEEAPPSVILISESGLRTADDSRRMRACGVDGILVGEALMRSADVARQISGLKLLPSVTLPTADFSMGNP